MHYTAIQNAVHKQVYYTGKSAAIGDNEAMATLIEEP